MLEILSSARVLTQQHHKLMFLTDDDNQLVLQQLTASKEKYENDYINASYIDVSELVMLIFFFL